MIKKKKTQLWHRKFPGGQWLDSCALSLLEAQVSRGEGANTLNKQTNKPQETTGTFIVLSMTWQLKNMSYVYIKPK